MKKKTRFKRTLDIPAEQVLTELHGKLRNQFFFQSGKKIELKEPRQTFNLMLKSLTYSETNTSILVMVKNDDIIEAVYSFATFTDDVISRAVVVLDERKASTISGMIYDVFNDIMRLYTTKEKEDAKDEKTDEG